MPEAGWTAQNLSMVASGLSRGRASDVREALVRLALVIADQELTEQHGWTPWYLAMMANGLSRSEGPAIRRALNRLAQSVARQPLAPRAGWTARSQAMMANALGKAEGPDIQKALCRLSERVCQQPLTATQGWTPRHLAMMANGLSKGEGAAIEQGLSHIAQAIARWSLTADENWTTRHLAMTANGLGKAAQARVQGALDRLAQAVSDQAWSQDPPWTAQDLGMMAHGLAKGEGEDIHKALVRLADRVCAMDMTQAAGWTTRDLAMLANGLGKAAKGLGKGESAQALAALSALATAVSDPHWCQPGLWSPDWLAMLTYGLSQGEGPAIAPALTQLAQILLQSRSLTANEGWTAPSLSMMASGLARGQGQVVHRALNRLARSPDPQELARPALWSARSLAMMMEATGQTLAGQAVFGHFTTALAQRAAHQPEALVSVLGSLSRFALSAPHLTSAGRLQEALRANDFQPQDRQDLDKLLWSTTLLHFACQQDTPVDQELAASFAQFYQQCLASERLSGESTAVPAPTEEDDDWHLAWARDYWQPTATGCPSQPPMARTAAPVPVPGWQQKLFDDLQAGLPGHSLQMAVAVNHCPVDIMIDGRVCIEADGGWYCVEVPAEVPEEDRAGQGDAVVSQRPTRDLFVDHMLRRYGYQVVRIAHSEDPAQRDELARQVRSALGLSVQDRPMAGRGQPDETQEPGSTAAASPPSATAARDAPARALP